jgi:lipoyl(octanoyl) transferase
MQQVQARGTYAGHSALEWRIAPEPVSYPAAIAFMDRRVADIRAGHAPETLWLLEHPALYTAGTSARDADLLDAGGLPVHRAGRGGQFTYHGPGQRIGYVMLDLGRRGGDVRRFVGALEDWIIAVLGRFGVEGERRPGRIGIWVDRSRDKGEGREDKIAAIGVRVRHWVTLHGVALNVDPDLRHFRGIVPCGIADARFGVTSLAELGKPVPMAELDSVLVATFGEIFGQRLACGSPGAPAPTADRSRARSHGS